MAKILVQVVPNANSSGNCLRVLDLELEGIATKESGTALRKTVLATFNETVTWWAAAGATLQITFDNNFSPFTGAMQVGSNASGSLQSLTSGSSGGAAPGRYKYTISLTPPGSATAVKEDPQIIIDNSTVLTVTRKRAVPKKAKRK